MIRRDLLRPIIGNMGMPGRDPTGRGGNLGGGLGGAPVAFSAGTDLAAGARSISLNQKTLQPGFRTAYFIDEIRFCVYTPTTTDEDEMLHSTGVLGTISARFQTGVHQLSQVAVPIGLYAPRFSKYDCGGQRIAEPAAATVSYLNYGHVRWALPKPLYMAPGDALQCMLDRDATRLDLYETMRVDVTYIGRIITQGVEAPKTRAVPWVSWFEKSSELAQVQAGTTWRNPFMEPLHVQRLTMRSYRRTTGDADAFIDSLREGLMPFSSASGADSYERLSLEDSLGYKMVSGSTQRGAAAVPPPVGAVFDMARNAWTFGRPLAAKEQFNATVTNLSPSTDEELEIITQFGLVGYREELA